jgi:radical SAM protein with 4Fe4S-binding SPASM domain
VNPIGDIFLCGYSTSRVGNIFAFEQLFSQRSQYYDLINARLPGIRERCYGCILEGICSGQCLVTEESSSQQNNRLDFLCEFYKRVTAQLLGLKLAGELLI